MNFLYLPSISCMHKPYGATPSPQRIRKAILQPHQMKERLIQDLKHKFCTMTRAMLLSLPGKACRTLCLQCRGTTLKLVLEPSNPA